MTWLVESLAQLPAPALFVIAAGGAAVVLTAGFVVIRLLSLDAHMGAMETESLFIEDPNSIDKVAVPSIFAPAQKYLTVVLPAYNEQARLPATIDETLRYLQQRAQVNPDFTYEILVVDDGSRDGTVAGAMDFVRRAGVDRVRVLRQRVNRGKGAAVRRGALGARGQLILFADADGATCITDLEKLEAQIAALARPASPQYPPATCQGIADVAAAAFGSRAHLEKQALATRKWYRNVLMYGFFICVVIATGGGGVRDTQCGFKMFTRSAARKLFRNQRLNRWCFDVELLYLCKRLRIPIAEVAVTWTEIPGSKLRPTSIIHMLFELVLIRVGYGLGIWKIKQDYLAN